MSNFEGRLSGSAIYPLAISNESNLFTSKSTDDGSFQRKEKTQDTSPQVHELQDLLATGTAQFRSELLKLRDTLLGFLSEEIPPKAQMGFHEISSKGLDEGRVLEAFKNFSARTSTVVEKIFDAVQGSSLEKVALSMAQIKVALEQRWQLSDCFHADLAHEEKAENYISELLEFSQMLYQLALASPRVQQEPPSRGFLPSVQAASGVVRNLKTHLFEAIRKLPVKNTLEGFGGAEKSEQTHPLQPKSIFGFLTESSELLRRCLRDELQLCDIPHAGLLLVDQLQLELRALSLRWQRDGFAASSGEGSQAAILGGECRRLFQILEAFEQKLFALESPDDEGLALAS